MRKPLRRSARLNSAPGEHSEQLVSLTANKTLRETNRSTALRPKGRKRSRETEDLSSRIAIVPSAKRPRGSADVTTARPHAWPEYYFEPDTMSHLLARRKSAPSLRRKQSGSLAASSTTPSDRKPRGRKLHGQIRIGRHNGRKNPCRDILEKEQVTPDNSLFRDDVFDRTCRKLQDKHEARVVQDIARLIVPSAETLATFGAKTLEVLVESGNEGWNNSIPLTGTRPQPEYSVGFKRESFTEEQREKLSPFIGDFIAGDQSFFMATYYMYFPLLTCEVKCGTAALDIADRQNVHSMTLAMRAIVELFLLVQREDEINREILAFSVSHDHRSVRIYGPYTVIDGAKTTFYHHPIRTFDFTELEN
ncbi:uncharacterized protein BDR25DRAFT_334368 [Lindgomyces ingoldianus]|uniref:Uncharacterized protein n=1 Tax=Lindgomyces ingoldianus TaxID=673940 RepID=A0ACB6QTI9_9PLEO|nr:uncharacterized protein BDR25DRAFT_334368 [Lindgomyces ingoldianus]KAF2470251.1 hypothetical protein BDR25DRAFT_334368 [Lindgomyces ingoldianus]